MATSLSGGGKRVHGENHRPWACNWKTLSLAALIYNYIFGADYIDNNIPIFEIKVISRPFLIDNYLLLNIYWKVIRINDRI
jgi:hypothetical protein